MDEANIRAIFNQWQQQNPKPTTELCYNNTFELLIAVMLSAQSTDISVNKATRRLFSVANTPQAILDLGLEELKQHIRTLGLYNSKASNILKTCLQLITLHDSKVPDTRAALEALPGVGRKTANVLLNTAFGHPTLAVDTHVFRVANRIGLAQGKTTQQVEEQLLRRIPAEFLQDAHHWLILHGRYVCKAQKPQCASCLINAWCRFRT